MLNDSSFGEKQRIRINADRAKVKENMRQKKLLSVKKTQKTGIQIFKKQKSKYHIITT